MSDDYPLVSIVTPSYNQGRFLDETIQSVLTQDYPRLEYLVMDGGSNDGSIDIIRRHADRLAHWVSEPDHGQAHAINKGFSLATGSILAWLNSDDTYTAGAVRRGVEALDKQPAHDLAYANCDYVDADGQHLQTVHAWKFVPRRLLTGIPLVIQPASFFRRRALDRVGPLDETKHYLMDHDLYVRMAQAGLAFQAVDEVWARFRWHSSSKTYSQWVAFNLELQQIVERTFAQPAATVPGSWRREARANVWQWLGDAYLRSGQRPQARAALFKAIGNYPLRLKTVMALALLVDAGIGTHLAHRLRRWRYRLPDAPAGGRPFEDFDG